MQSCVEKSMNQSVGIVASIGKDIGGAPGSIEEIISKVPRISERIKKMVRNIL